VVLDPFVTAQFLGIVGSTLNGEAVLKGRSLFANRLDDEVAASQITLIDDATNPLAYTASEVDGEGLATRRKALIEGGVLRQFVHSAYSGRRSGAASTGNAVRGGFKGTPGCGCLALSLLPGTRTQADLVKGIDDGVLIQMVTGLHSGVNPISGDFSTGASGLLIHGGELAGPVKEFTIASTLQRMLTEVVEVGNGIALALRHLALRVAHRHCPMRRSEVEVAARRPQPGGRAALIPGRPRARSAGSRR
jgi:PmbA protein